MGYTTALGHTPQFSISKDGADITGALMDRVTSIRVESRDGGGEADVCDIIVDDRGWSVTSPSLGEGSATLSVALGYAETALYQQGTFQVDEIYYEWSPKQLRVHGNSLGMTTAAKAPIIASYEGKSLGDIIGSLAQAGGVEARVDPALAGIQVPFLNQSASSMHQVQELERRFNGLAKWGDGYLSFTQRGTGDSASGQSIGTFVLGPEDLGTSGNSIKATNQSGYSQVKAGWFDKTSQTTKYVTSTVAGNAGSDVPFLIRRIHPSQVEAQSAADSTMAQLNRRCKEGTIILSKGAPQIRGGQGFAIAGCREGIDGSYLVRRAVHSFTKDAGIATVLDVYDEGNGVDFSQEASSESDLDFSGVTTSVPLGQGGIGHA